MDVDHTLQCLEDTFGKISPRNLVGPDVPSEDPLNKVREKVVRIPRAKAHLAIGFRAHRTLKNDDRFALEVLNNVLAGQGGRLFAALRDKESLAYIVTSFISTRHGPGNPLHSTWQPIRAKPVRPWKECSVKSNG